MIRFAVVSAVVVVLCMMCCAGFADEALVDERTIPPGVIRWDTGSNYTATPGPTPTVYTLGAPIADPQAIDIDEFGRLYVIDHRRQSVMRFGLYGQLEKVWPDEYPGTAYWPFGRMDLSVISGERLYLGPHMGSVRHIDARSMEDVVLPTPSHRNWIAAAEDGSFYLDSYLRSGEAPHSIARYSSDGQLLNKWSAPIFDALEVGPDGLIYALLNRQLRVMVYTPDGKLQREISLKHIPGFRLNYTFEGAFTVDSNGDLYIIHHEYMYRLDPNGKIIARWRPYRADDSTSYSPFYWRIAARNGLIYAQVYNARSPVFIEFQVFTPSGQCVARYIPPKLPLTMPFAVAVHADGSYAVAQRSEISDPPRGVVFFDAAGDRIGGLQGSPSVEAIAPGPDGTCYVAHSYKLDRVDSRGNLLATLMKHGDPDKNNPFQLAVEPATGNLWGLGWSGEMMLFGPDDKLIMRTGERASTNYAWFSAGMAVDSKGFIYLPDSRNSRIMKYDPDLNHVLTIGKEGTGLGQLKWPEGVAVDSKGRILIADTGNCRIHAFDSDGRPLGFWGRRGSGDGELCHPLNLTIASDNTLWIADTLNDRIVRISLDDFWKQLRQDPLPDPVVEPVVVAAAPGPGDVTVEGIVVAGSGDFTDSIYIENPQRAWGVMVTLPQGITARRGEFCRVTGKLEMRGRMRHIVAKTVDLHTQSTESIQPLGIGNLFVGNGSAGLKNDCLLVRTWGKVISVDPAAGRFVVNDGSSSTGLAVYAGELASPITTWPKIGQYVALTGISAQREGQPVLRIRSASDIEVFSER